MDTCTNDTVFPVSPLQTGMGGQIGSQTQGEGTGSQAAEIPAFTTALKARILDALAKVEGKSFAAYCIQLFVRDAHLKSDYEVKKMVKGLQSQITDNPAALMRILGSQYDFLRTVKWSEAFV